MKKPTVLLADDHAIVRDGLQTLLEPHFEIVGSVNNGREMLDEIRRSNPDIVLADISMPVLNGIEATRQLFATGSKTRVLILTMHADVTYATEAFDAGASGYALKHSPGPQLIAAIREVLKGQRYVAPEVAEDVRPFLLNGPHQTNRRVGKLTTRQREVLQLLAEGHTNKVIAGMLDVSPRTVEFHKYKMMQDLGLRTSAELIRYAMKHGIASA
jgi:DNA-binding NarL/FixJ family response regulator